MYDSQTILKQGREIEIRGKENCRPEKLEEGSASIEKAKVRFFKKLNPILSPDECWIWNGAKIGAGYGGFHLFGRCSYAHRAAWSLFNELKIPTGMIVMHKCDTPPCVNPAHLVLGTVQSNIEDKCSKMRHPKGDSHPARIHPERLRRGDGHHYSKLNSEQVIAIRKFGKSMRISQLASMFNISPASISLILSRKTWAHIA